MADDGPYTKPDYRRLLEEVRLAESSLRRVEDELRRFGGPPLPDGNGLDLLILARSLYAERRLRDHFFPGMFGEPGWDLLLELYIARLEGRWVNATDATKASRAAATTGLRLLDRMEAERLIVRRPDPRHHRGLLVELTEQAFTTMTDYLLEIGTERLKACATATA